MTSTYWACAQTHRAPGSEALALRNLKRQRWNAWYPFWLLPNRWNRLQVKPVFPGYVFIEVDAERSYSAINSTLGIRRLLTEFSKGDYRRPSRCTFFDNFIGDMRRLRGDRGVAVSNLIPPGATVRIMRGPFAERVALVELSEGDRIKLMLEVFSRNISVEFGLDDVQLVRLPETA